MNIRTAHMLHGLYDMVNFIQNQATIYNVLEIGSFRGDSAKVWAEAFPKVYCVDPWLPETTEFIGDGSAEEVEAAFDKISASRANIVKMKMTSEEAFRMWENDLLHPMFEFTYIDGDHSYEACRNDILAWATNTTRFIGIHDVGVRDGVTKALKSLWPTIPEKGWVSHFCDTSIIIPVHMVHTLRQKGVKSEYED